MQPDSIPYGRCHCGCGQLTSIATRARLSRGPRQAKGEPMQFIHGHSRRRPVVERFWEKVDRNGPVPRHRPTLGPCWIWIASTSNGYGHIRNGDRGQLAHRLSWELNIGDIPKGLWVLHACDNPGCVNPNHLFLGTMQDNTADMVAKGRHRVGVGEQARSAKLSPANVLAIRAADAAGQGQASIARSYGVTRASVHAIVHRRTWKHI